jgi:lipoprotein-anchoring transpeptidase ErfK/SrfK
MVLRLLGGVLLCSFIYVGAAAPCRGAPLDPDAINNASFESGAKDHRAVLIKTEVLLDRAGFSPGVLDARDGGNFRKAVAAFQGHNELDPNGVLDRVTFGKLAAASSDPVIAQYVISDKDVQGPFQYPIPADFAAMAKLPRLSYTGPRQALAERFHMDEKLLVELNPGTDFGRSGTRINVANVGRRGPQAKAAKIVVDKRKRSLWAFDGKGRLLAFYPASIGSKEKPAPPNGEVVTNNPTYRYDPKFAFKGVNVDHSLTIKPGPNNPVGLVWIGLSAPSYGIHGAAVSRSSP